MRRRRVRRRVGRKRRRVGQERRRVGRKRRRVGQERRRVGRKRRRVGQERRRVGRKRRWAKRRRVGRKRGNNVSKDGLPREKHDLKEERKENIVRRRAETKQTNSLLVLTQEDQSEGARARARSSAQRRRLSDCEGQQEAQIAPELGLSDFALAAL